MKLNTSVSCKPCKSRKLRHTACLSEKRRMMRVRLSKELREKTKLRAATVKKGDRVQIVRGSHKKTEGVIARVNYAEMKVAVNEITVENHRKQVKHVLISPANIRIMELNLDHKRRALLGLNE